MKKLPRDKAFTTIDLTSDADAEAVLLVEWRAYAPRAVQELPEKDHPRRLELVVTYGGRRTPIAIGEHAGAPAATSLSTCRRQGYLPGSGATWQIPALFNVVSTFSMATMQSGDDFLLLMGHDVMRLLHRRTSDGACGAMIFQGPLQACADATENAELGGPELASDRDVRRVCDRRPKTLATAQRDVGDRGDELR